MFPRLFLLSALAITPPLWALTDLDLITEPGHADYPTRYKLTYAIPLQVRDEDRLRLEKFLSDVIAGDLSDGELAALKNNVADVLINQDGGPRTLLDRLKKDWADERQGLLWRSYIVQKIPELTLKLSNRAEVEAAVAFLRQLASDPAPEFYGTAIMGMDRLSVARPDLLPSGEVARAAAFRMGQAEAPDAARISLLQVWARHDAAPALREARAILLQENALILLKMSALAVIGAHGTPEDGGLIRRYLASPEGRLSTAAESAQAAHAARFR